MFDLLVLFTVLAIGVLLGYNVALQEGRGFGERFQNFVGLRRPPTS